MNGKFYSATLFMAGLAGFGLSQLANGQAAQGAVAADSSDDLGEIVVTARRVEERAQDVPISMTIFTQAQLSDRNIVTSTDLANATPGVAVDNQFGNDLTSFSVRGFAQQLNTTPSVAVYFADAVLPRGGSVSEGGGSEGLAPGTLFDLQNVQVLKGPQGTLFGRNTDGGAVLVVPKKPTSDFEGYVQGGYGNYADGEVQGVLNVPLGDAVRVRLGVNHQTRDGFENNISGIGPSDFDNLDYTAARLSVVVDITPDIENYTIGSYNLSVNNGVLPELFACQKPSASFPFAAIGCDPALAAVQASHSKYPTINDLGGAESYLKQYQVINTTTWRVSDSLTVKNVANYGLLKSGLDSSLFGGFLSSPYGTPFLTSTSEPTDAGGYSNDQYTWSDELQLSGNLFDNKLTWQGGGYVERSGPKGDLTGTNSADLIACEGGHANLGCAGPGITNLQTTQFHYNDQAVFGQATYAIVSNLKVTGGIRYTSDQTTAVVDAEDFAGYPGFFNQNPPFFVPYTGSFSTTHFPASCASTGASAPANGCTQNFTENSHAPTYLLDVDYNPIQDMLLYAKYSRGYRQGSVAPFTYSAYQLYRPEFVNSFEVGEKTTFSGPVPGTFDVTAHYNAFSDQQLLAGIILGGANATSGIVNAGKSRIWGIEVESTINPIRPLTLGVSYAYLNTELESATFTAAGLPAGTEIFFPTHVGNVLPFSPRNKVSANATYRLPVPDVIGTMSLGANVTYTSSELISEAATPYDTLGAYGLLGANFHWDSILGSNVDAELFGTNLANRYYYNNLTQLYSSIFGMAAGYPGEPRMYGLRVKIRFGGMGNK